MKKIFLIILIAVLNGACQKGSNYKIAGFYEGSGATNTTVYLLGLEKGIIVDTLATGSVLHGRFELEGRSATKMDCRLLVKDEDRNKRIDSVDFVLSGANFFAHLSTLSAACVTDNSLEVDLASAFYRNERNFEERKQEILRQFVESDEMRKDSLARLFERLIVDTENEEMRLVEENKNSRVSALAVSETTSQYIYRLKQFLYSLGDRIDRTRYELAGWDNLLRCYSLLSDEQKRWLNERGFDTRMKQAKDKMERVRLVANTSVGKKAPDMVLTDKTGKEIYLHGIEGKLKIVDFWASWCGPCRKTNPFMLDLWREFKTKGLEIVSVSVDERKDAWLKAVKEDKLTWRYNVRDLKGQASGLYGITAVPCVLLLDENNKILGRDLSKEELYRVINEELNR